MWPFSSRKENNCDHEFEKETDELFYPNTLRTEDGEVYVNRVSFVRRNCKNCRYSEVVESNEERVYLSVDRTEEVEEDV